MCVSRKGFMNNLEGSYSVKKAHIAFAAIVLPLLFTLAGYGISQTLALDRVKAHTENIEIHPPTRDRINTIRSEHAILNAELVNRIENIENTLKRIEEKLDNQ